ncbi:MULTISPECIES: SixA phosphatase family protein [Azotobacter]|nr:histidine phosphatase family protein [Azotobacter vinelandii]WKN23721.1 histidine phosphatase family protein [Azotobacter vinelandii]
MKALPDGFLMKKLFLIRHAKSPKEGAAFSDRDRPLAERGRRDLEKMGRRLAKRSIKPDLILSSPALRTLATAEGIARLLDYSLKDIETDDRLYACQADELLDIIRTQDDKLKSVLLVGHNPQLAELARRLSGKIGRLPTCSVVEFKFDAESWSSVGEFKPAKVKLDRPK